MIDTLETFRWIGETYKGMDFYPNRPLIYSIFYVFRETDHVFFPELFTSSNRRLSPYVVLYRVTRGRDDSDRRRVVLYPKHSRPYTTKQVTKQGS